MDSLNPLRRRRDERGSGPLSAAFGVAIFLTFLLLATHVMVNLWARSTVRHAAAESAYAAATDPTLGTDPDAARQAAERRVRSALGSFGSNLRFRWGSDPATGQITLRVSGPGVAVLGPGSFMGIDVVVAVRAEDR